MDFDNRHQSNVKAYSKSIGKTNAKTEDYKEQSESLKFEVYHLENKVRNIMSLTKNNVSKNISSSNQPERNNLREK